ncbi:unnamed protein product [Prunus armeniaca]
MQPSILHGMAFTSKVIGGKRFLDHGHPLQIPPSRMLDDHIKLHGLGKRNTPAEFWLEELKTGRTDPGYIPLSQNLSNLIRLAMLYKYGGIYLDTDLIILKDFSGLRNAIEAQSLDSESKIGTD